MEKQSKNLNCKEKLEVHLYTIRAHQEMYAELKITAVNANEALAQFKAMMSAGQIHWLPSDEDLEVEVHDEADELILASE